MMNSYEQEQREADVARSKDAAWKPACTEVGSIQVGDSRKPGALKNFCLDAEGNILAAFAPDEAGAKNKPGIRVYSPKGELQKTLPLEFKAGAICVAKDGSIFAAGDGKVVKLDASGKVLASAASPVANEPAAQGGNGPNEHQPREEARRGDRPSGDRSGCVHGGSGAE